MMAHHFRRWKDSGHSDKLSIRTVFMPRQQNMESVTPSFNKPPIVEVAVCVSFPPIEGFSAANFGLFWQCIRTQFTRFRQMPELPDHIEPAALPVNVSIQTQLVDVPNLRGWYISEDDTEVVQIQNNRFIYNWRRGEGDAAYPRYDKSVRIRFMEEWQRFQDYLQSEGLTISKVHQCELTYVNQIPFGSGWTSLDDLNKVFVYIGALRSNSFLQSLESAKMNLSFVLPDQRGRLRAAFSPVPTDGSPAISFTLSVRGAPSGSTEVEIMQWMDTARKWIVNAFTDLTTINMHKLWERVE